MAEPMRSLSVQQPWAWAIMHGGKTVENRPWGTTPGTVAIHAGLKFSDAAFYSYPMQEAWGQLGAGPLRRRSMNGEHLHAGVILGTVDLVEAHRCDPVRGCWREADVLGWVPFDGSDASAPGWQPRFCSPWGEVPTRPTRRGSGHLRHLVLANPRPLQHPIPFTGHQGIRRLDPKIAEQVAVRLRMQR